VRQTRAQVSFEFILIFSLVFLSLSGFIYIINQRLFELSKKQEVLELKQLADSIVNEVSIANSMNNNYVRKFDIPQKILGKNYRMRIDDSELTITVLENNNTYLEYFTAFPIPVKGSFIQNINYNTTQHCISRSYDGVRISRTQASIDPNVTKIGLNGQFEVFVSLHCVKDTKSARFTLKYDPEKLTYKSSEAVVFDKPQYKYKNPLFDKMFIQYNFQSDMVYPGRFSFGYLGKNCVSGSGNFAKVIFKVNDAAAKGMTEIVFDEDILENINILDCYTDKNTIDALPDSKNNAKIEII
jgi:hypothetical protein